MSKDILNCFDDLSSVSAMFGSLNSTHTSKSHYQLPAV